MFLSSDLPCLPITLTLARLMVGDHQRVNLRLGIWFNPDRWALVSFFHFIDSSKPLAFSLGSRRDQAKWCYAISQSAVDLLGMAVGTHHSRTQAHKGWAQRVVISHCRESSPEKPLPGRKVSALEECVFQNAFHTTQGLDHICTVVVQVPELPIMPLVCPPERVLLQNLDGKKSMVTILSAYCPRMATEFPNSGKLFYYPLHVPGTA